MVYFFMRLYRRVEAKLIDPLRNNPENLAQLRKRAKQIETKNRLEKMRIKRGIVTIRENLDSAQLRSVQNSNVMLRRQTMHASIDEETRQQWEEKIKVMDEKIKNVNRIKDDLGTIRRATVWLCIISSLNRFRTIAAIVEYWRFHRKNNPGM